MRDQTGLKQVAQAEIRIIALVLVPHGCFRKEISPARLPALHSEISERFIFKAANKTSWTKEISCPRASLQHVL